MPLIKVTESIPNCGLLPPLLGYRYNSNFEHDPQICNLVDSSSTLKKFCVSR